MSQLIAKLRFNTFRVNRFISHMYNSFLNDLMRVSSNQFPPFAPAFATVGLDGQDSKIPQSREGKAFYDVLRDIFDPLLWTTPKKRTSVFVRKLKKFGIDKWAPHGSKLLKPKNNLIVCRTCGNFYEPQYLCNTCYERVRAASIPIQKAIAAEFTGKPIEQEVEVVFKGESRPVHTDKTIIEVEEERPPWFSKNLLSKTHVDHVGTDVKETSGDIQIKVK